MAPSRQRTAGKAGAGAPELDMDFASQTGPRPRNEDYAATHFGSEDERRTHGAVAAVADGIGGAPGGREAAEQAVDGFIAGYYAEPPSAVVKRAAGRALAAVNRRIHNHGLRDPGLAGMGTTLSAVVFRGRKAHVLHVGDSRVYRLRQGRLVRLTEDHNLHEQGLPNILVRAVGIEGELDFDYRTTALKAGDRFLLCTDGVCGALSDQAIRELLGHGEPAEAARRLNDAALETGVYDNVTALVADVVALP